MENLPTMPRVPMPRPRIAPFPDWPDSPIAVRRPITAGELRDAIQRAGRYFLLGAFIGVINKYLSKIIVKIIKIRPIHSDKSLTLALAH